MQTSLEKKGKPSSSPWKILDVPRVVPFSEICDEEMARNLQMSDGNDTDALIDVSLANSSFLLCEDSNEITSEERQVDSDFLLAQILQNEFDLEADKELKLMENSINKNDKVRISFDHYRKASFPETPSDDSSSEEEDILGCDELDFESMKISKSGSPNIEKHDSVLCGIKNSSKLFSNDTPCIQTGNLSNIRISNEVYNSLKVFSHHEQKNWISSKEDRKYATSSFEKCIDSKTKMILFKCLNSTIFTSLSGCIATGKESVIYHAVAGPKLRVKNISPSAILPSDEDDVDKGEKVICECAVKIFKMNSNDFRHRSDYMFGDNRFKYVRCGKTSSRSFISAWTEKELRNLKKMRSFGVNVPLAFFAKKNVLVMEFIGKDRIPALRLKDLAQVKELRAAYKMIQQEMVKLYRVCKMVHGDLNEFNILWHNSSCVFIDVGQSVNLDHPKAMEFLRRDCQNIFKFFAKFNLNDALTSPEDLYDLVTKEEKEDLLDL